MMNLQGINIKIYYPGSIFIYSLSLMALIACTGGDPKQDVEVEYRGNDIVSNEKPEHPTTEIKDVTPIGKTIFNSSRDLWGWISGEYIVLKWDPKNATLFNVYRKVDGGQWVSAHRGSLNRNEFFDADIKDHRQLRYRVEAVDMEGNILHRYDPLEFVTGS